MKNAFVAYKRYETYGRVALLFISSRCVALIISGTKYQQINLIMKLLHAMANGARKILMNF